jgi:RNA polymerase sigma-70 factor (ECF subfamily)
MTSDKSLIIELQTGRLDALGMLYDRHRQMVYRTALGITGDNEAASDLLQDVFLRLHRFAQRVDPERPLEPWLYRVTANLAYTWVKQRRRWFSPLEDIVEWFTGPRKHTPHQMVEFNDDLQQVANALSALPLQQRTVVVMYYLNDLSIQEVSEVLNVPVGTVKSRLHYGREALKKHLGMHAELRAEVGYEFT